MANKSAKLRQLLRDQRGNTLMLAAGMFLPLLAFAGAGIDISRGYMAKARLQSACDSAVLAARKVNIGPVLTADGDKAGQRYFTANFGKTSFGSHGTNFKLETGAQGTIRATASTNVDTSVMRVFGQTKMTINANCTATRDLGDADVMFVLDVTGSMAETNPGDPMNRMETLRGATLEFFDNLEVSRQSGSKLRYGFLPYNELANVGYLLRPEWMASWATYQSRRPDGSETSTSYNGNTRNWTQIGGDIDEDKDGKYFATTVWVPPRPATEFSGAQPGRFELQCNKTPADKLVVETIILGETTEYVAGPPAGTRIIQNTRQIWNGTQYSTTRKGVTCHVTKRDHKDAVFTYQWVMDPVTSTKLMWMYEPIDYYVGHLRGLTSGGTMEAPIGTGHTKREFGWDGCIEERATVRDATYDPIPAGALDMDIDLVPISGDAKTQWKPALPQLIFKRPDVAAQRTDHNHQDMAESVGGASNICPPPARNLGAITRAELQDYLDTLKPFGGTHHDIGMIWGARLLSPSGIFAKENTGKQSRHMIFMTDGQIEASPERQDAYGFPRLDRRRHDKGSWPTTDDLQKQIELRFLATCKAARARGITVWMIAFGTELSPAMKTCSGENRAFEAASAAQLQYALREIAGGIAKLRLVE